MSQIIQIKDPADRLDVSYVFANNYAALQQDENALVEMCKIAKDVIPGVHCRAALVHPGEITELVSYLKGSDVRPEVVIDFPDGLGGVETKREQARVAAEAGAVGGDLVINLHHLQKRNRQALLDEFKAVKEHLNEVKVIAQIPYLWQYDKEAIAWLMDILIEADIYCLKDWTTRNNFLLPGEDKLDSSLETRFEYLEYMANIISSKSLPLILKTAGQVTSKNVKNFINAGATLIGTSYRKAPSLREALLNPKNN